MLEAAGTAHAAFWTGRPDDGLHTSRNGMQCARHPLSASAVKSPSRSASMTRAV